MSKYMVGCIPVRAHPEHPTDQSPCIQVPCPNCGELMWFSEKKRALVNSYPEHYGEICLDCAAMIQMLKGVKLEEVEMVNIDVSGGIQ